MRRPGHPEGEPQSDAAGSTLLLFPIVRAADRLTDIERARIAAENQHRALTKPVTIEAHGYTIEKGDPDHPDALLLAEHVAQLRAVERAITRELEGYVMASPFGPWIEARKGIGAKSIGRLLGLVGNPAWHPVHERPRTLGQLKAYCGLHVIDGRAPRRKKGVQGNWNTLARTILIGHIAESAYKQGHYRTTYEAARLRYESAVHEHECRNRVKPPGKPNGCGTRENPEWGEPGSPLRPGHQHARALRAVAKAVLRDLYDEGLGLLGVEGPVLPDAPPTSGHVQHSLESHDLPDVPEELVPVPA